MATRNIGDLGKKVRELGVSQTYEAVVPDNDKTLQDHRAIYIGTAGNLVVEDNTGTEVSFVNVPAGSTLPIYAAKVKETTTAANLVILV